LKSDIGIDTTKSSFFYGVQSGQGGITLEENAYVAGNIYANGNVDGGNGSYASGNVWVAGGTALTPEEQQTTSNSDYTFGRTSPTVDIAQSFKLSASNVINKVSFYVKKVGLPANATVRIVTDNGGVPSKTVVGSGSLLTTAVTTGYAWVNVSFPSPPAIQANQTYWITIDATASGSDYWIIGSLTNNGYGNGIGMVSADWSANNPVWNDAGRDYAFKVWTGGVATQISGMHVMGTAYANTLLNDTIDGPAYYQNITNTTIGGGAHPNSPDPGPQDMPITDAQ